MYHKVELEMELPDDFDIQGLEFALIAVVKGLGANVRMVTSYDDESDSHWSYNVGPNAVAPMYLTDRP
jgi:hypothetical protein